MTEPIDSTTPIGRFVFQLLGSIAELERETIIERTSLGKRRVVLDGRFHGGKPPLGYRVEGEKGNRRLVVDDAEAEIVREMFRLYCDGKGLVDLCLRLDAMGVTPPNARRGKGIAGQGRWNYGSLQQIITNPMYKGSYLYGKGSKRPGALIELPCPAIVEPGVWDRAQAQRQQNWAFARRNAKRDYLLHGLVRCGLCGHAYVGEGRHARGLFHYVCSHHGKRYADSCDNVAVRAEVLEDIVWQAVVTWAQDPAAAVAQLRAQWQDSQAGARQDIEQQAATIETALTKKQQERDAVIRMLRREIISYDEGERQLGELAREMANIDAQRQQLFATLQACTLHDAQIVEARLLLDGLRERIDGLTYQERREIVETLVAEVVITPGDGPDGGPRVPVCAITYRFGANRQIASSARRPLLSNLPLTLDHAVRILSASRMADELGVSHDTAASWARSGRLAAQRVNHTYYVRLGKD